MDTGSGLTLFGTWRVGTSARQREVVRALSASWPSRSGPDPGLRCYEVLASTCGTLLLHRSEWAEGAKKHAAEPGQAWKREVDRAVPGIERLGVTATRLYRHRTADGEHAAGCVVLVTREFETPDLQRARRLVDALVESTESAPPPDGLLSARFYVSVDGRYVFNYAEWRDETAHHTAITNRLPASVDSARWQQVHQWPGLLRTGFDRFHPAVRISGADRTG
ncbi:antibiotic biosynthesis monooxygenase [Streptomyces sp. WMMB 322]|uniref:antibiotic biosynthesis monooxygenase n=1 Tax=Streptomyces sp. WMMB 322 TaxID=1286821 RepID=UPI0006E25805|nr:antibiotic biosynthesis monooxygenase [Streptomyces sp. WMMB 322]SCK15314.1 Antibiotic biosynthesis monooxygenase [Streptomyces sp. WMMB 322]